MKNYRYSLFNVGKVNDEDDAIDKALEAEFALVIESETLRGAKIRAKKESKEYPKDTFVLTETHPEYFGCYDLAVVYRDGVELYSEKL